MMEKVDLKSDEVIAKEAAFHSKTEVNFERIVFENERNCLETLVKFQSQGSN